MKNKRIVGFLGILGIWITAGVSLPLVGFFEELGSGQLMLVRGGITALLALLVLRGDVVKISKDTLLIALVLPLATLGLFQGISLWGASQTIVVITATPVVNLLFGLLVRRKFSRSSFSGFLLLFAGVLVACWGGYFNLVGFLWAVFGMIMNGVLYELFAKSKDSSFQKCFWASIGMALLGIFLSVGKSWEEISYSYNLVILIGFGLVGGFLYWISNLTAFENLPTNEASILAQGETIAVIFGAFIILGESLTLSQWIGVFLALVGAVVTALSLKKS